MKKSLFTVLFLLLGIGLASADTKNIRINDRSINAIDASAGVSIKYIPTNGSGIDITITGDADKIERINIKVSGKTLNIAPKSNKSMFNGNSIKGVTITVKAPIVSSIETGAGASVTCNTPIVAKSRKMDFEASSGSSIKFASIQCKSIDLEVSSGASISLNSLSSEKADLEASSGAGISVGSMNVNDVEAEASSGASIKMSGKAAIGDFEAPSGGTINARGLIVDKCSIDKSVGGSVKISKR